jgi:sigma-B regulation protein RsbU (phosphoserine phosphatase)
LAFDVEDSGQFMTMFYLNLDTKSHNFTWVRAGHDPAIVYDPHSDSFTRLDAPGIALGVDGDWRYEQNEQPFLSNGQIVLLGTDGIWEVQNQAGEMLGKTPIMDIIRQSATATATQILDAIFDRLKIHVRGARIEDDITAVIIKSQT